MTDIPTIIYTPTDEAPLYPTRCRSSRRQNPPGPDRTTSADGSSRTSRNMTPSSASRTISRKLRRIAKTPGANIIKLPNISASVPQLKAAIAELQGRGYDLPDYPEEPSNDEERMIKATYDKVKGSAVNPVLREGNSDRRAPLAVKEYARNNPHRMGAWSADSKSHVATMSGGDFRSNERSVTVTDPTTARIEHVASDGTVTVMKDGLELEAGEVVDSTFMSRRALVDSWRSRSPTPPNRASCSPAHEGDHDEGLRPIIFSHAVRVYFKDVFRARRHLQGTRGRREQRLRRPPQQDRHLPDARSAIEADIQAAYDAADMAMVDSDRGITNLHVPSDIIIDASMPVVVRDSGKMWNPAGELQDAESVIPDSATRASIR